MIQNIVSEQQIRKNRSNNIIIHNMPELEKIPPDNESEKKEFFQELSAYTRDIIAQLLSILNPSLKFPTYSNRHG